MSSRIITEELTPDGQKMWDNIEAIERLLNGQSLLPADRRKPIKLNMFEIEVVFIRTEIRKMIKNSKLVVTTCDDIIRSIKTKEEYLTSEAKVAKQIHLNLIARLERVLDSRTAFEHEIFVDDEPERPYKKRLPRKIVVEDDIIVRSKIKAQTEEDES